MFFFPCYSPQPRSVDQHVKNASVKCFWKGWNKPGRGKKAPGILVCSLWEEMANKQCWSKTKNKENIFSIVFTITTENIWSFCALSLSRQNWTPFWRRNTGQECVIPGEVWMSQGSRMSVSTRAGFTFISQIMSYGHELCRKWWLE